MVRSLKKGFYIQYKLLTKIKKIKDLGLKTSIKTWSRNSTIIPDFVGSILEVYNGKKFLKIYISEDMVGHKLGEFSHTRFFKKHPSNNKNRKPIKK